LILSLIKTMQYTNAPYVITEEEDNRIRNRRETFIRETGTEVLITMITSYGLAPGGCKTLSLHMVVFIRELTLALFDNTFVTHMDDFSIRQIHNILINSYLQKRVHKRGISDKIYLKTKKEQQR
jgi:hypothetical protein